MMTLVWQWNIFARGELSERSSYTKILVDAEEAHRYSIVWKVGGDTPWTRRDRRDYIPEDYWVVFRAGPFSPENSKYYLIDSQNRNSAWVDYTRIIRRSEQTYLGPKAYLGAIRLKRSETDPGMSVSSVAILYKNPMGRVAFYPDNQNFFSNGPAIVPINQASVINEFPSPSDSGDYKIIELDIHVDGWRYAYTIELNRDLQPFVTYKD